jgi:hypothetical protein
MGAGVTPSAERVIPVPGQQSLDFVDQPVAASPPPLAEVADGTPGADAPAPRGRGRRCALLRIADRHG